jgi:2,3-dihydroxy-p-cumate/2,3-dihydroxybenzoate 3,4-dioxygenase
MTHDGERTSRLRFAKLGYIAINVSNIERSRYFYETLFGLQVSGTGPEGEVYLRCSSDYHNLILYPNSRVGLRRVAWQLESEAEAGRFACLAAEIGLELKDVPAAERKALHQEGSYRFTDPFTGALTELFVHDREASGTSFTPTVAKIQRLGHIVLTTPHYEEAIAFYREKLNFRISDAIGSRVTFMRCFPNPYHHSFGIARGSARGLHHINFMVSEIDDIGRALWRYQKNDVPIVYGPGRHPPSNSVFLYASDPDGITVEYSYGMEEFPETGARQPRPLPQTQESSDSWGGPPPRIRPVLIEGDQEPDGVVPTFGSI